MFYLLSIFFFLKYGTFYSPLVYINLLRSVVSKSNTTREGDPLDNVMGLKTPRGTGSGICTMSTSSSNPISRKNVLM